MPTPLPARPLPALESMLRMRDALLALADMLTPTCRRVRAGEAIFESGQRCCAIHVLDAGLVRLSGADGGDASFRFRGDWLGLEALVPGRHATTAEAMDGCVVWSLDVSSLLALEAFAPGLSGSLAEVVERHDRPWPRAAELDAPAERRLAQFLLAWADALVRDGHDERRLGLRPKRSELGSYLRMPAQAVDRALGALAAAGALDWDDGQRREIRLDDRPRLQAHATAWSQPAAEACRDRH